MIFLFSLLIFIFDQLSKAVILRIVHPGESFPIINNIFHITLVFNPGAAFGIFSRSPVVFIVGSIFTVAVIIIYLIRRSGSQNFRLYALPLSIIMGGALGNLFDRLRFGFVVDFLDFRIWPVFNIADIAISAGAVLLIWRMFREKNVDIQT